ncbi:family 1 glycosylhydrolase [Tersicoccus sp. MR15.9]|uniref:family 1 glycosylhydrolase n=1 Tax=Tersicoccus mangrovi TaxID=3121635 RepID=UPI002FE68AEC
MPGPQLTDQHTPHLTDDESMFGAALEGAVLDAGAVPSGHLGESSDDAALAAALGLDDYRFCLSWPQVQPDGGLGGSLDPAALDHWDALVDRLLAAGVRPIPTLHHGDLPPGLEAAGGWTGPQVVERFTAWAEAVAARLGDRVDTWITLNEPVMTTLRGGAAGDPDAGARALRAATPTAVAQLLAHATAARAIRATRYDAQVGLANDHARVQPASDRPEDIAAAGVFDVLYNRLYTDPVFSGDVPQLSVLGGGIDIPDEHRALIAGSCDFYGVNLSAPLRIGATTGAGADAALPFCHRPGPTSPDGSDQAAGTGWMTRPDDLRAVLIDLRLRHAGALPPLLITENAATYPAHSSPAQPTMTREDLDRIDVLAGHLRAVAAARREGLDLLGYSVRVHDGTAERSSTAERSGAADRLVAS